MLQSLYKPIESDGAPEDGHGSATRQEETKTKGWFENIHNTVDKTFIVSKLFYFFFYTALGSLFPFFSLYYKQLWLNTWQIGILLALRPAVKIVCLPLWKMVTDKYSKPKVVYFISMFGWIIGYYGQSFVFPTDLSCYVYVEHPSEAVTLASLVNATTAPLSVNISGQNLSRRTLLGTTTAEMSNQWDPRKLDLGARESRVEKEGVRFSGQTKDDDQYAKLKAPFSVQSRSNEYGNELSRTGSEAKRHKGFQHAEDEGFQRAELEQEGKNQKRWETRGDTASYEENQPVAHRTIKRGRKSINQFPPPSEIQQSPKPADDFRVRFNMWIFRSLIVIVILTEIITTPTPMLADSAIVRALVDSDSEYGRQRLFGSLGLSLAAVLVTVWVSQITTCAYTDTIDYLPCFYVFEIAIGGTLLVSLFFKFEKPETDENGFDLKEGLKLFKNFKNGTFLVTLFLFGYSHSLQIGFLFWYLQDLGGTPALFALILLVYCFAEVVMYFVSPYIIGTIGQHGMISIALACYTARFLMYSNLTDPWLVIPMEVVQGVTYGGVWSIAAVYVDAPPGKRDRLTHNK